MAEARPQAPVRLSFQPLPVHVRTARLVAVTVARRSGWDEEHVESVRQAVGEACTLALRAAGADDSVTVELDDDGGGPALRAWVWPVRDDASPSGAGADALARAVLAGLTDDVGVEARRGHPALRLSWTR